MQLDSKHCISCAPRRSLTAHADWKEVIETLRAKFHTVKLPKSFLAVNLSESHTFHKKDDAEYDGAAVTDAGPVQSDVAISSLDTPDQPPVDRKNNDASEQGVDPLDTSQPNPAAPAPESKPDVPKTPDSQSC